MRGLIASTIFCVLSAFAGVGAAQPRAAPQFGAEPDPEQEYRGLDLEPLPEDLLPDVQSAIRPGREARLGDELVLEITVLAAPGDRISIPEQPYGRSLDTRGGDPFELLRAERRREVPKGDRVEHAFRAHLLALEVGTFTIAPELRVLARDNTLGKVDVPEVAVNIVSVLGNEPDAQPRPPSEPVPVIEEDYTLAYVAGTLLGVLLLALLMFTAAYFWARRKRPEPPPPPPRPAEDVALEQLSVLRQGLRDEDTDLVQWADELSDCVRAYLGGRFDFDGLESTTDEIVRRLRRRKFAGVSPTEIAALLGDLDLVKFAKATPSQAQCEGQLEAAERVVVRTRRVKSFGDGPTQPPGSAEEPAADNAGDEHP